MLLGWIVRTAYIDAMEMEPRERYTAIQAAKKLFGPILLFLAAAVALILFMLVSFVRFHREGVMNWWRRRKAGASTVWTARSRSSRRRRRPPRRTRLRRRRKCSPRPQRRGRPIHSRGGPAKGEPPQTRTRSKRRLRRETDRG